MLLLSVLTVRAAWCQQAPSAEAQAAQRAQMEQMKKLESDAEKKRTEIITHLRACKPIEAVLPESLSLRGDGLFKPQIRSEGTAVLLNSGTLHIFPVQDFNQRALFYWLDSKATFAEALKEAQAQCLAQRTMMMSPEQKKQLELSILMLSQCRTPADLDKLPYVSSFNQFLKGNAALSMAQVDRINAAYALRQKNSEELIQAFKSWEKKPDDAALATRIFKAADQISNGLAFFQTYFGDFFTAAQKRAVGIDPDTGARDGGHSVSVSAFASAGGGSMDEMTKKYDAERKEKVANAKLKFNLKGSDADQSMEIWVRTGDGILSLLADPLADKSGYSIAIAASGKPWLAERAEMVKALASATDDDKAERAFTESSPNWYAYFFARDVEKLRRKTGSVPEDVQTRLNGMVQECVSTADAVDAAYKQALEKPDDPKLQRALFDAVRAYQGAFRKNCTIQNGPQSWNPTSAPDDTQYLLNEDQSDLAHSDELSSYSGSTAGSNGSMSITGRPAGKQQMVNVSVNGMTLGNLESDLQKALRQLYHNHKLTISVDGAVAEKGLKGVAEGKSAEEVLQSLALRAGVNVSKDEKDANHWIFKQ